MSATSRLPWLALAALLVRASIACSQPAVSPLPREAGKPDGGSILLTPQEHRKLLDQIDQLKKELAARKTVLPSGCAIHAKIEKRGESSVAALRLTYTFRTTAANSAITLGAKRSFLVAATLDGQPQPALEAADNGFTMPVEATGVHTAVLDVECPITARGGKPEIGFELGLPRAAITTLILEPAAGVTRVALTTRSSEAGNAGDPRRIAGLDVKTLAAPSPMRGPYPLGPVESLEIAWEPPVATPATDAAQSAEIDASTIITETLVETTARLKLRGTSRAWRVVAPMDAIVTAERGPGAGASEAPAIAKPTDAASPVWKLDFPPGSAPADWTIVVQLRLARAKPTESGPFAIGPLAVLDVAKLAGALRVVAPANTRLTFRPNRDLRQEVPPVPPADDETVGFFRIATGPTGGAPSTGPLLTLEAAPLAGRVAIRPNYKLTLSEAGWYVKAEIRVVPVRTSVESVLIEIPAVWRGVELAPPNLVADTTELKSDVAKLVKVSLAAEHRQPFDLVLTATIPIAASAKEALIPLPRFPSAAERDSQVSITVPDGIELRGTGREREGEQAAVWGVPLTVPPGPDGKLPRNITNLAGKFERGLARLDLSWSPFRPPLTAEVRADLTVRDSQIVVSERVVLRSQDPLPRNLRFTGAPDLPGLAPFDRLGPGSWMHTLPPDQKEATLLFNYAIPLPAAVEGKPRSVPVKLVLPAGTSRTDVLARIWVTSAGGRTISVPAPGAWRLLPPEPAAEREALPAVSLAGSGGELPLVLEIGEGIADAATVWIERGLVQASHVDDSTAVRARFLLRRWFADAVEVKLPAAIGTAVPEVFLDEPPKRIPAAVRTENGERILRIPLPESRPGRSLVLDIRFTTPNGPLGEAVEYFAPEPRATFAGPIRWQVTGPAGTVSLLLGGQRGEQHWRRRLGMIVPASAGGDELEKWLFTGAAESSDTGALESVVVRVQSPTPLAFIHLPRLVFIIGCSIGVLMLGLLLSRFPSWLSGPMVAVLAGAVAVATVLYPQPATQIASAAEPGFAALVLVLVIQAMARWRHRQRITHLPGFTRSVPNGGPGSAVGSRPSDRAPANASTGAAIPQPVSTGS